MQIFPKHCAKARGLTLAELVIALAVLGLALAGILAAIVNGMSAQSANRQRNVARDAAVKKLDEARSLEWPTLTGNPPPAPYAILSAPPVLDPDDDGHLEYQGATLFPPDDLANPDAPHNFIDGLPRGKGHIWVDMSPSNKLLTIHVVVTWERSEGNPPAVKGSDNFYEISQVVTQ